MNTSSAHAGLSSRPGAAEESKDAWDITGAAVAVLPAMSGRAALRAAAKRNPEHDRPDLAPYPLRDGSDWQSSFFRARCSSVALASLPELALLVPASDLFPRTQVEKHMDSQLRRTR